MYQKVTIQLQVEARCGYAVRQAGRSAARHCGSNREQSQSMEPENAKSRLIFNPETFHCSVTTAQQPYSHPHRLFKLQMASS